MILPEHLRGIPGLRASTRDAILARQPKTVREMIAIPFVGRPTARRLYEKGLVTDPGPDRALPGLPER